MATNNHPSRSKRNPKLGVTPTREQLRLARDNVNLTQEHAAHYIFGSTRAWENYEADADAANKRSMHAGLFVLFQLLTRQVDIEDVIREVENAIQRD